VLTTIEERHEERIVAVTHRDILLVIIAEILFNDAFNQEIFERLHARLIHANTGITKCSYDKAHGWRVLTWSDDAHLG
jgi:broad specificity phosphatase PhoE